jgi:hypothetical protein
MPSGKKDSTMQASRVQPLVGKIKDDFPNHRIHLPQQRDDRFPLHDLRLAERWNDGELHLLLHVSLGDGKEYIASIQREVSACGRHEDDPPVIQGNPVRHSMFRELTWRDTMRRHVSHGGEQKPVLVDVIQGVKNPQKFSLAASVWLDSVNGVYGCLPHALYLSRRFGPVFRGALSDWEVCVSDGPVSGSETYRHEVMSNVVKGTPQVADCISDCQRNIGRYRLDISEAVSAVAGMRIVIMDNPIAAAVTCEGVPFGLQFEDMLFGPLRL